MTGQAYLVNGEAGTLPLPDGCIQAVVTSIPYWGLRSYGTAPRVWGGDTSCVHEWCEEHRTPWANSLPGPGSSNAKNGASRSRAKTTWPFCIHCNAWRGEYGSEPTPELFVANTVQVFREVRRVLRDDGTVWLNIGDSYNASTGRSVNGIGKAYGRSADKPGHDRPCRGATAVQRGLVPTLKPKDLVGIPWRIAFALQADGWYLRQDIIWHKPNPMPSSVTDRCTTGHEYVFLLTKSARYFYDADAIREPVTSTGGAGFGKQNHSTDGTGAASRKLADPAERNNPLGRNKRSVWTISTHSFPGAHFVTFPPRLVEPCIKAGTSERGCCAKCGAPWKRIVERVLEPTGKATHTFVIDGRDENADAQDQGSNRAKDGHKPGWAYRTTATTWTRTCTCNAGEPISCKVLDLFSGAGTTAGVARDLGRIGIGVELNHAYCLIARDRLAAGRVLKLPKPVRIALPQQVHPAAPHPIPPAINDPDQFSLFAEAAGAA